jgi:hypothetical protein
MLFRRIGGAFPANGDAFALSIEVAQAFGGVQHEAVILKVIAARLEPVTETVEIDRSMPDASLTLHQQMGGALGHRHTQCRAAAATSILPTDRKNGAGEGIRTLDPNLGKVVLYP